jgi:4-amino-4-deoxy-L-arabinose transferase-like glycosyltransferase
MAKRKRKIASGQAKPPENIAMVYDLDASLLLFLKRLFPNSGINSGNRKTIWIFISLLTMVTILFIVPFAGKAFHIDDPMYLWAAKHILHSPLDFYGFNVNWYGIEEPMSSVMKNPPLVSYYLAIAGLLFGWGEITIHLVMLFPAIFAILGVFFLARQLCPRPFEATLICLFTTVFLVSATTVMCDVLMLAFWIWAVCFWISGLDQGKYHYLALSALLMSLAALSKYYGIALIPLLFAYSLIRKRRLGWWTVFFLIPFLVLGSYQWFTQILYGEGLLTAATQFPSIDRSMEYTAPVKGAIGLNFLGGCLLGSLFYLPLLWRRGYIILGVIIFFIASAFMTGFATIGGYPIQDGDGPKWGIIIQFSLFFFVGLHMLALVAADLWMRRDATSALLAMWILGTLIFASHINWTINARSMLPLLPAAAILIVRRLEVKNKLNPVKMNPAWALIPAAALGVLVTWSDYSLARCGREAAIMIDKKYGGNTDHIWYQGHWGFQYYMDSSGKQSLFPEVRHHRGDIVIVPENAPLIMHPNPKRFIHQETIELSAFKWLTTLSRSSAAGFYGDAYGPLPYAFGFVQPERYFVWKYDN